MTFRVANTPAATTYYLNDNTKKLPEGKEKLFHDLLAKFIISI